MSKEVRQVVVIGGGPAGALLSYLLAKAGVDVLLVEKERFPRNKACGGCLNARGIGVLRRSGLADSVHLQEATRLSRLRIWRDRKVFEISLSGGIVLPRAELDLSLLSAARNAGVEVRDATNAQLCSQQESFWNVELRSPSGLELVRSHIVIGAHGLGTLRGSTLRSRRAAKTSTFFGAGAIAINRSLPIAAGELEMTISKEGYVGLIRSDADSLLLGAALSPRRLKRGDCIGTNVRSVAGENSRLSELPFESLPWITTPYLAQTPRFVSEHRLFLVGDGAGFTEPLTGEGISWALRGAELLAPIVQRGLSHWDSSVAKQWQEIHAAEIAKEHRRSITCSRVLRNPLLGSLFMTLARQSLIPTDILTRVIHGETEVT